MRIVIAPTAPEMGRRAAAAAADAIGTAIASKGSAAIILATGASQFTMLEQLVKAAIDRSKMTAFRFDEYAGLPDTHPASFRKYLRERFVRKVRGLRKFHHASGDAPDLQAGCRRLNALISTAAIDVACIGIGENGHVGFNDPPADFVTETLYLVAKLDDACRRQQVGEGWFPSLQSVPAQAITMSARQIMKSVRIVCTVPNRRKAEAVRNVTTGPVMPGVPASILQTHPACELFLDTEAASLL